MICRLTSSKSSTETIRLGAFSRLVILFRSISRGDEFPGELVLPLPALEDVGDIYGI